MTVAVRSALDVVPQAWRNGGGATRELLAWPNKENWQVRISLAEIDRDGAFSQFAGVQRWFGVVQGPGVVLDFGGKQVLQTIASDALQFDGVLAPFCSLQGSATQDMNLMLRSIDTSCGAMNSVINGHAWINGMPLRALFAASAGVWSDGVQRMRLQAYDFLWSVDAGAATWRFDTDTSGGARAGGSWWLGADMHACKDLV
jgi:uncharacterized protein